MRFWFYILASTVFQLTATAQSKFDSIYLGTIKGMDLTEFEKRHIDKYAKRNDSLLGISKITESQYDIEIRLYESPTAMTVIGCTVLYLDSAFHIKNFVQTYNGWELKTKAITLKSALSINPDSTFSALIAEGIFDLNGRPPQNKDKLSLVKGKLAESKSMWGFTDYTMYTVQTKVKDVFNEFSLSGEDMGSLRYFPDNQIARRMISIANLLRLNPFLKRKEID